MKKAMTGRARGAFTLVELSVAGMLLALVVAGAQHVMHVALRGSTRSADVEATLRAMAIGLEVIGRDARLFAPKHLKKDLHIAPDGRSFSLRVASSIDRDLWSQDLEVVKYALVALPGDRQQLVRTDRFGTRPVGSCVVSDMRVQYVPAGKLGARQGYLQVTLLGPAAGSESQPLIASELLPVAKVEAPRTFGLEEVNS